jgi:ribosomal protein S18 acetylase RimI-like enzyme
MIEIRTSAEPLEREKVSLIDASYSTEYIYRILVRGLTVEMQEEKLDARLQKSFDLNDIEDSVKDAGHTIIAESEGKTVGFAAVRFESWNNRAVVAGIYVAPEYKRRGIGKALVREAVNCANALRARCLWLETQNLNYPAINFYLKMGFKFCGFDSSLYDPNRISADEVALYFSLDLD